MAKLQSWKIQGFKSATDYHNHLAKEKGFKSYEKYLEHIRFEKTGYLSRKEKSK